MDRFSIWLLLTENGRLDQQGFNSLFRAHLDDLIPLVTDPRRRQALEEMREFGFIEYILASLRNAGFNDRDEREAAAHDVTVYLLVSPGQLFGGYDPLNSGPMPARFALSVSNAIRNLRRDRARRERRSPISDTNALAGVPDREPANVEDDELLNAFRHHLRRRLGERAVQLLDLRIDDLTYREIGGQQGFSRLTRHGLRSLVADMREEARIFARRAGDEEFLARVERLLASRRSRPDQDD